MKLGGWISIDFQRLLNPCDPLSKSIGKTQYPRGFSQNRLSVAHGIQKRFERRLTVQSPGILNHHAIAKAIKSDGSRRLVAAMHHRVEQQLPHGNARIPALVGYFRPNAVLPAIGGVHP